MKDIVFKQFINSITKFVWWKDRNGLFLGANKNLLAFAGLNDESEIIGKTDLDLWDKEEAEYFMKIDREIIETGKSQLNFEEPLTLPDQGKRWLSTSKIPMYDDDNNIVGTIGWFKDITEIKQMQLKIDDKNQALIEHSISLEQANRDLEFANIDLEKFTYAATHDLKSPIIAMKTYAKLLKEREESKLDEQSLEFIDYISEAATRMGALIDNILNFARTGSTELKAEHVDISKLVNEKLIDLKEIIKSKGAIVKIDMPPSKIVCYPHVLGLLFYNLFNNGLKYNTSTRPTVACSYTEEKNAWLFTVEDNGIGIRAENAEQIFEPFKRLGGEAYQGTGIGLSICKRVANLHEGDIWIKSSEPGKTIFQFSIAKNLK